MSSKFIKNEIRDEKVEEIFKHTIIFITYYTQPDPQQFAVGFFIPPQFEHALKESDSLRAAVLDGVKRALNSISGAQ